MYELLKEFVKPEMLVLIPVLYLMGIAIKRSQITDKLIPWILGAISVVLCGLYIASTTQITGWQSGIMAIFTSITQGILIAGCSVYVNQLVKQSKKVE